MNYRLETPASDLIDQLRAKVAENERLREALEKLARLGNEPHYGNSVGNDIARKALVNDHCQCPACKNGLIHDSDCAVHNMPAYPNEECDCKQQQAMSMKG